MSNAVYQDKERLKNLYDEFGTGVKVAQYLGVPYKALMRYMRKYGITHRDFSKKSINEDYFANIDTQDKAYYLGLLTADSCVYRSGKTLVVQWNIAEKDKLELIRFNNIIESTYNIYPQQCSLAQTGKEYHSFGLAISNHVFVQHLIDHGVAIGKDNRLTLPILNDGLMSHFLRGYFDGDGYISVSNRQGRSKVIASTGYIGRLPIINSIIKTLNYYDINFSVYHNFYHSPLMWTAITSARDVIQRFYDFLYQDANIFFQRKKDKFTDYLMSN